jgi:hypothetical protein
LFVKAEQTWKSLQCLLPKCGELFYDKASLTYNFDGTKEQQDLTEPNFRIAFTGLFVVMIEAFNRPISPFLHYNLSFFF